MKTPIIIILLCVVCTNELWSQSLNDLFKEAAENNLSLKVKYNLFESALQKVERAKGISNPKLSFGYFVSPIETRAGNQEMKLSLSKNFPWFGTLVEQKKAASLMANSAYADFINERNKLFFRVAEIYYEIYETQQFIRLEEENLELLVIYKTIATTKFENGRGSMVDIVRVNIMIEAAQTKIDIMKDKLKPINTRLIKLLNRKVDTPFFIKDELNIQNVAKLVQNSTNLKQHPLLSAIEFKRKASISNERLAYKMGLPQFGFGLDYLVISPLQGSNNPSNGNDALVPMISVSIPLFRNQYKAAVKDANLQKKRYELMHQDVSNQLSSDYEQTTFEIEQQRMLYNQFTAQAELSKQALDLLFTNYSNSGNQFEEVLRIEQQLLQYKKEQATAIRLYFTQTQKLNYLISKPL